MLRKYSKLEFVLNCLIVLVISSQTIVASADAHQLHPEDVNSIGMDEHAHIIGNNPLTEPYVSHEITSDIGNIDDTNGECEHAHVHVSSTGYISISADFPSLERYSSVYVSLQSVLHDGTHTLPFRPPIS